MACPSQHQGRQRFLWDCSGDWDLLYCHFRPPFLCPARGSGGLSKLGLASAKRDPILLTGFIRTLSAAERQKRTRQQHSSKMAAAAQRASSSGVVSSSRQSCISAGVRSAPVSRRQSHVLRAAEVRPRSSWLLDHRPGLAAPLRQPSMPTCNWMLQLCRRHAPWRHRRLAAEQQQQQQQWWWSLRSLAAVA